MDKEAIHAQLLAEANWRGIEELCSGTPNSIIYYSEPTGSSYVNPYQYPVITDDIKDLWKCESCGRVYRLKEHLSCETCGTSVTEKSRFVLE